MTASLPSYAAYVSTVGGMAAIQSPATDSDFQAILPAMIDYAEQRIYREIDFLSTATLDTSLSLTVGNRSVLFSSKTPFVTLQSVNLSVGGSLVPLEPVSRELLNAVYGSSQVQAQPVWFAVLDGKTLHVGPYPDQPYALGLVGTVRPDPLSAANQTTFLSQNLPDLFLAASMIFVAGYQKNFGAQADDPKTAMSWEQQYQTLKESVTTEEARRKFQSAGWSSLSAPSAATPTR